MVVITGGPGAGKTTLIDSLADHGFTTVNESGRAVLQSKDGMKLRDEDPLGFALAMLDHDKASFDRAAETNERYAFDRGFPDIVGYLNLMGIDTPKRLRTTCDLERYSGPIFAAPPWQDIYQNDAERTQSFETARATYDAVTDAWRKCGYKLIVLPLAPVDKRIDFMLDKLG